MGSFISYVRELNLFQSNTENLAEADEIKRLDMISTRIYTVALIVALHILGFVLWLTPMTITSTLQNPSQAQFEALPIDAFCPCAYATPAYGDFITLDPEFHQVCQSDFVTDRWIKTIFSGYNVTYFLPYDFRAQGSALFLTLANFCRLAKQNVLQNIVSFQISSLISPQALSKTVLEFQVQAAFDQFKLKIPDEFNSQLRLLREIAMSNQLVSALHTSIRPMYYKTSQTSSIRTFMQYVIYENEIPCECYKDIECKADIPLAIVDAYGEAENEFSYSNNRTIAMTIPGLRTACTPVDTLLGSSLECFYNQSCMNQLLTFFNTNAKFVVMNVSNSTQFQIDSTVQSLMNYLFVEKWKINISYANYFGQCAPVSCTFSESQRRSGIFVLLKLISVLSGLTVILQLLIPLTVRFFLKKNTMPTEQIALTTQIQRLVATLKVNLFHLNLFSRQIQNERHLYLQRTASRLYICSLIICIDIFCFYTLSNKEVYRDTLENPSEAEYHHLMQTHPESVSCPCKLISTPYFNFTEIKVKYHPVCSSDFVSLEWINYNIDMDRFPFYFHLDYRRNAAFQFQLLATLCNRAKETIQLARDIFLHRIFVSSHVIPKETLYSEMNQMIEDWKSNTINRFSRTIQLIRTTNHGNQYISSSFNAELNIDLSRGVVVSIPRYFNTCSCAFSPYCRTEMRIYDFDLNTNIATSLFRIRNFFIGCSPLEALFASTLEYFYYQSSLDNLATFIENDAYTHFTALNRQISYPYETIEHMANNLMVQSWSPNVSFTSYYKSCSPMSCTYEYTRSIPVLLFITSMTGIAGGLSLILNIFILCVLRTMEEIGDNGVRLATIRFIRRILRFENEEQLINRSTFAFISTFLLCAYLLALSTVQIKTAQVMVTSLSTYENLTDTISDSFQCPCSQISFQYKTMITIIPRFHQICASDFMRDHPSRYLIVESTASINDFLVTAPGQLLLIQLFCQFSANTVASAISQLLISSFVSTRLLSRKLFEQQIRKTIDDFKLQAPNEILNTLTLVRETMGSNMIMNTLSSNWKFNIDSANHSQGLLHTTPIEYDECNCGQSTKCVHSSRGMLAGCYPLDALLHSTLECFYNQSCLYLFSLFSAFDRKDLSTSRFYLNTTMESLVGQLMVEEYSTNLSYEKYFAQCSPVACNYLCDAHQTKIEIVTLLISLYSGLILLVGGFLRHAIKWNHHRRRNRIHPIAHRSMC